MYVVVSLCVNLKYVLQIDPVFQLEDMSLCVQICSLAVQTICFVSANVNIPTSMYLWTVHTDTEFKI